MRLKPWEAPEDFTASRLISPDLPDLLLLPFLDLHLCFGERLSTLKAWRFFQERRGLQWRPGSRGQMLLCQAHAAQVQRFASCLRS